jgi:hypothetical protein
MMPSMTVQTIERCNIDVKRVILTAVIPRFLQGTTALNIGCVLAGVLPSGAFYRFDTKKHVLRRGGGFSLPATLGE